MFAGTFRAAVLTSTMLAGPTLDLSFLLGPGFTRASVGTYFDSLGVLQTAAVNVPRYDYTAVPLAVPTLMMEPARTNTIRNNTMIGAVAGTPGTLPTNWAVLGTGGGLTITTSTVTTESGLPAYDIRLSGTSVGGNFDIYPDGQTGGPAAVNAQVWTLSVYHRLTAGTLTNCAWATRLIQLDSGNATVGSLAGGAFTPSASGLSTQRAATTFTLNAAATASIACLFRCTVTAGAVDMTVRIGAPQLALGATVTSPILTSGTAQTRAAETGVPLDPRITFTRASVANYFDATGTLQSAAANIPRIDYNPATLAARGLLIEEARTNSIRNPRAEAAVAGTPGTLPTYWTSTVFGLTRTVVGTGTETGIPYIDISFSGTVSSTFFQLDFENTTSIAAVLGQVWTGSWYWRLMAGSFTNISLVQVLLQEQTSAGVFVNNKFITAPWPTGTALAGQRASGTATLTGATTGALRPSIFFNCTNGSAISFTIRVGGPQLELGAFATSVILPVVGTPAVSTRAADVASLPVGTWFNPVAGTMGVDVMATGYPNRFSLGASLHDGTVSNMIQLSTTNNGGAGNFSVTAATVSQGSINVGGAIAVGTAWRIAGTYAASLFQAALGGAPSFSVAGGTIPVVTTLQIGDRADGTRTWNGYIRRVRYWPRALSLTELRSNTI